MREHFASVRIFICVLAACALGGVASAQDVPTWTNLGPVGAYVKRLLSDPRNPNTLYAGMVQDQYHPYWGVYKSTDGGNTWNAGNTGLQSTDNSVQYVVSVYALALDPTNSLTLYAGTNSYTDVNSNSRGGAFKSTDGGNTWNPIDAGLAGIGVESIVIDRLNPLTVYIGTDVSSVYKSTDGGMTWSPANAGLPSGVAIPSLAIDATSALYAGAAAGGVFKSTDGANTWNAANAGLPSDTVYSILTIDPINPTTVYTGGGSSYDSNGILFKSTDGGNTWANITSNLQTDVSFHDLEVDPTTGTLYVATFGYGVFISVDGGNTWSDLNSGLVDGQVHAIVFTATNPTTVYVGTCTYGVFTYSSPPPSDAAVDRALKKSGKRGG